MESIVRLTSIRADLAAALDVLDGVISDVSEEAAPDTIPAPPPTEREIEERPSREGLLAWHEADRRDIRALVEAARALLTESEHPECDTPASWARAMRRAASSRVEREADHAEAHRILADAWGPTVASYTTTELAQLFVEGRGHWAQRAREAEARLAVLSEKGAAHGTL